MHFGAKLIKNPLAVVIMIMILYVAFTFYSEIGQLSRAVLKIQYWTVPLIFAPMTLHLFVLAIRFHRLLKALNINIPIRKSILIYFMGLSLTVTPGSSGQIIKSQVLKKQFGYAISKTSPIILIEKWNELTSVILILIVLATLNTIFESNLIILIGIVIGLLLFAIMRNHAFFTLFKKILLKFRRLARFEENIENSQDALRILSSKKVVLEGFLLTTPAKILEAISVFFAFQALGIKINFIGSTQIFFTALLSGIISFVPGGFGVTEGSMLALLIKYYDKDLALLAASVIFVRLITLWYATFLGIVTSRFVMRTSRNLDG